MNNNEYLTDPDTYGFSLLKLQYLKYILFKIFTEKGMSLERILITLLSSIN